MSAPDSFVMLLEHLARRGRPARPVWRGRLGLAVAAVVLAGVVLITLAGGA